MTSGVIRRFWKGLGRGIAVLGLGVVLMNVGILSSLAQVPEDTVRTDTARGEQLQAPRPAAPDTLQPEALAPPFDPAERERPAADTGDSERAFVNADSLSTRDRQGERIQEMFGNVYVRQDTTRLYSEYAIRYLNSDELLFVEDVVIYERGDTLQADSVRYNRSTKVGRAWGNVRLTDGDVVVRAPRATYFGKEKRSVFPDSITLVDSSRVLRAQEGIYWSDEQRAEFGGTVRLTDPNTYLEADSLTYFRDRERSIARGDVFIDRRGGEDATADTTTRTYLFGERADNREKDRYSRVETQAALVQVRMDSTGTPEDTLVVRAHRLEAFRTDTHRRLVAVDSVEIWQPELSAVADSAVYDRVLGATSDTPEEAVVPIDTIRPPVDSIWASAQTGPTDPSPSGEEASPEAEVAQDTTAEDEDQDPAVPADTTAPPPDSTAPPPESLADADTTVAPSDSTVQSDTTEVPPDSTVQSDTTRAPSRTADASVQWETPTVQSEENLPLEETRLYRSPDTWFEQAQVWGDSIRVRARNRSPDTVFVRGSSFAAQQDTTLDRIQQLKGRHITAFFQSDSLRRIVSRPNAEAIRFMTADDGSLSGAAQTSGDRIVLRLRDGSVKRISVLGGVQSTYYRTPEDIPEPFQLEGFQWTPERRPTQERLLQDERIRRRLDLDATQRPPVAQRTSGSSPSLNSRADSGQTSSPGGRSDSASVREASSFEETGPGTSSPTESFGTSLSPIPDSMAVDPASLLELSPLRETPVSSDTSDTNNDPDA